MYLKNYKNMIQYVGAVKSKPFTIAMCVFALRKDFYIL